MLTQIKVISVGGKNFPISDRLYELLLGDANLEAEIGKIVFDALSGKKKAGAKKK